MVTATDPDGEMLSIRVDIRVTNVDEAPLSNRRVDPTGQNAAANPREVSWRTL